MFVYNYFFKAYHTYDYDKNRNYCNHLVEYTNYRSITHVGQIKHFFECHGNIYCIVERFIKKPLQIEQLDTLKNEIEHFFVVVETSKEIDVIPIEKIIRKCIKIVVDTDTYLTYCVDNDKHDLKLTMLIFNNNNNKKVLRNYFDIL